MTTSPYRKSTAKVTKIRGLSSYYHVEVDGEARGMVRKDDMTGEWRAYWYAEPRNYNLGDFSTRQQAVREIEIEAL